jgi:hypothetical protein
MRTKRQKVNDATKRAQRRRILVPEGTKEDQPRLMNQMEIGDPIFDSLLREWRQNCSPSDKEPKRNSNAGGAYFINVGNGVLIAIDNRWHGEEILVQIGNDFTRIFSTEEIQKVKELIAKHQIFNVLA